MRLLSRSFYHLARHKAHSVTTLADLRVLKSLYTTKMPPRQALLLSSSNCHGYAMLEFAKGEICSLLREHNVGEILFIPYAQNDLDTYTAKVKSVLDSWGLSVTGIHTYPDPVSAVYYSRAVFVGGGNTFLLLKRLYETNLISVIRKRVNEGNLLYIGSSAGTNVATKSIHTTNDMPIIYPPSFDALGIVPFNINPHYIDKVESETHKGETRDQRICEYMDMPHAAPVLGLREGAILKVDGNSLIIKGVAGAAVFMKGDTKCEFPVGANVSFLCEAQDIC